MIMPFRHLLPCCLLLGALTNAGTEEAFVIASGEEAAQLAIERSGLMRASTSQLAAVRHRADAILGFARPQVDVGADGGVAGGTRNQNYENDTGRITRFGADGSVTQYLFGFGRVVAARRNANAAIAGAEADSAAVRRDLAYRARIAVADVLLARELTAIATRRVEQRGEERTDAETRREVGIADGLDVADIEIRVAEAEAQLELARAAEVLALEALADVIDVPVASLTVTGSLARPLDLAELLTTVRDGIGGGSDLARLAALRQQADALARGERADRLPIVYAFAGGDLRGDRVDDLDDGWSAGLRLDWRLVDGGVRNANANAADAEARALLHQTRAVLRQRQAAAASLSERIDDLNRRIAIRERIQTLSRTLYDEIRSRYEAGTETLLRVNEANLTVFEAAYSVADLTHQEMILAAEARRLVE